MYSSKKLHKIALSQQRTTKHVLLIWQVLKFEDIITQGIFCQLSFIGPSQTISIIQSPISPHPVLNQLFLTSGDTI